MLESRVGNRHYLSEKSLYLARAQTGFEAKPLGSAAPFLTSREVVYSSPKETRMRCSRKRYSRCRTAAIWIFGEQQRLRAARVSVIPAAEFRFYESSHSQIHHTRNRAIPARGLSLVPTTNAFFFCTEFERFSLSGSLVGACSQRGRSGVGDLAAGSRTR